MKRYILRFTGHGLDKKPMDDVERIKKIPNVNIVDEDRLMLLVETTDLKLLKQTLKQDFPDWSISPVRNIPLPGTHKRIKRDPNSGQGNSGPAI